MAITRVTTDMANFDRGNNLDKKQRPPQQINQGDLAMNKVLKELKNSVKRYR